MSGGLFDQVLRFPDPQAQADYDRLVGLDAYKDRLVKEALLLLDSEQLTRWSESRHGGLIAALDYFVARPPLFILAGDVGTGKTALARSFGSEIGRRSNVQVQLHALSLTARGSGAVGEMTKLISSAFKEVCDAVAKTRDSRGRAGRGIILLIDEADALAQSREAAQMHHEDRAGVNALIRGIDEIAAERLPVVVVMNTNRLEAIDPAVRRRAAAVFEFHRPTREQRVALLRAGLEGTSIAARDIEALADLTGPQGKGPGFTFSDLSQRLIPAIVLDAFPDRSITGTQAIEVAKQMHATPAFRSSADA